MQTVVVDKNRVLSTLKPEETSEDTCKSTVVTLHNFRSYILQDTEKATNKRPFRKSDYHSDLAEVNVFLQILKDTPTDLRLEMTTIRKCINYEIVYKTNN